MVRKLAGLLVSGWIAATGSAQQIGGGMGGGTGGGFGGSTGGGTGGSNELPSIEIVTTPPITGVSAYSSTNTNTNQVISPSNFLRPTYGNVYFQGRAGAQPNERPGGFGQALYGTMAGGATGGNIGFAGAGSTGLGTVTGTAGRTTGGLGGTTGAIGGIGTNLGRTTGGFSGQNLGATVAGRTGGLNNTGLNASGFGQIVPLPRPISYPGVLKFQTPVTTMAQIQTELRGMIDRSSMIANPRNITIEVSAEGVILRGSAADEDEARMIEGMVRLTPGVHNVVNELTFPQAR